MSRLDAKDLSSLIQEFFLIFLIKQKQASKRTVNSYRDCFKLYFTFLCEVHGISPVRAEMKHLERDYIIGFMSYLQNSRQCSENTINQRMSVLKSFLRKYVAYHAPEYIQTVNMIHAIPPMRFERKVMCFITREEYQAMLKVCDNNSKLTIRDKLILSVFYNTGCRVSELVNIQIKDLRNLEERNNASVLIHGKGRKERIVPLWNSTAKTITTYIKAMNLTSADFLIISNTKQPMTRSGIGQRISRLVIEASKCAPSLTEKNVTCHSFRHSVAMNMLQAGVDISTIAIFLGHESIETTHKYIVSDIEMKKKALEKTQEISAGVRKYKPSKDILNFLSKL